LTIEDPKLDCLGCAKRGKCCDFQPFIPNYVLGRMLEAGVELPDAGEHHWQPIGLVPDLKYRERHALTPESQRGDDFLCRFFDRDTRECSVYEFRPSECRFYFCEGMTKAHEGRSERGFKAETQIAQLCLKYLEFSEKEIHRQIDVLNLEAAAHFFDFNEMSDLYRRAWAWAGQLAAADVEQVQ